MGSFDNEAQRVAECGDGKDIHQGGGRRRARHTGSSNAQHVTGSTR